MRRRCVHPLMQRQQAVPVGLFVRYGQGDLYWQPVAVHELERMHRWEGMRRRALRRPMRSGRNLPGRPHVRRRRLYPGSETRLHLRNRGSPGQVPAWKRLPSPQLLHRLQRRCRCRGVQERRRVQPVQVGNDRLRDAPRVRIDQQPRQRMRSDAEQGVQRTSHLHRRLLQVGVRFLVNALPLGGRVHDERTTTTSDGRSRLRRSRSSRTSRCSSTCR
jgi:hypothetical protein